MVRQSSDVSDAEMEVLQVLWREGPASVRDVINRLGPRGTQWAYTTVQTLLARLEVKGIVASDKAGAAHVFNAVVSRDAFLAKRLSDLAEKVCDGEAIPLVAALMGRQDFTPEELTEFRRLLDDAARANTGKKAARKQRGTKPC